MPPIASSCLPVPRICFWLLRPALLTHSTHPHPHPQSVTSGLHTPSPHTNTTHYAVLSHHVDPPDQFPIWATFNYSIYTAVAVSFIELRPGGFLDLHGGGCTQDAFQWAGALVGEGGAGGGEGAAMSQLAAVPTWWSAGGDGVADAANMAFEVIRV